MARSAFHEPQTPGEAGAHPGTKSAWSEGGAH
jgi:hypothetical protein